MRATDSDHVREEWRVIRDGRRRLQREQLITKGNVQIPRKGCGFNEIEKFQKYYLQLNIAIVVYDKKTFGNGEPPFFDGHAYVEQESNAGVQGVITLCYDPDARHYDTILNVIGMARTKFFCSYCNKCFHFVNQYKCSKTCSRCFASPACKMENVDLFKCRQCNRYIFGINCYENHLKEVFYKKIKFAKL